MLVIWIDEFRDFGWDTCQFQPKHHHEDRRSGHPKKWFVRYYLNSIKTLVLKRQKKLGIHINIRCKKRVIEYGKVISAVLRQPGSDTDKFKLNFRLRRFKSR